MFWNENADKYLLPFLDKSEQIKLSMSKNPLFIYFCSLYQLEPYCQFKVPFFNNFKFNKRSGQREYNSSKEKEKGYQIKSA
jgi:hypothetical protein